MLRKSSNGVVSSTTLAILTLAGLRSIFQVDGSMVEFFVGNGFLDGGIPCRVWSKPELSLGCGAGLRAATVAHDECVFPPTSQTGSDERGKVEVGFGICCASDMLGA